ncbi:MAG: PQQ-dependent sugar dehydrogenase [Chloroflexota bacterium]
MLKKINICFFIVVLLFSLILQIGTSRANVQALPPGFAITEIVSDVGFATGMVLLPNNDIFVLNKGISANHLTDIRLVKNGVLQPEPVISLYTNATTDSGLLAIVLDPAFEENGWFYVYYATGAGSKDYSGQTVLRLSRFTYDPVAQTADPESETYIIDGIIWDPTHHGNSLLFDDSGSLLMGLGDRSIKETSQDLLDPFRGKIVRITPLANGGYLVPADNPFVDDPEVADEIFALGVRNPFRIAVRSTDKLMVVGDVGSAFWEEINLLEAGKNYGWPVREGKCNAFRFDPCTPTPSRFTDPIVTYRHDEDLEIGQNGALTGLGFYEDDDFPADYQNKLFFADFNQGFIAYTDVDNPGDFEIFSDADPGVGVVDIIAADGGLYVLNLYQGKIYFVYYTASQNQVPSASFTASTDLARPDETVTFNGTASNDPDGIKLTFKWDFGDGTTLTTSEQQVSHTYESDGTYKVSLQVEDIYGAQSLSAEKTVFVYSGELPEIELIIQNAITRTLWHGGDAIRYEAVRSDQDGLDPDTPYTWQISMHHNEHVHPQIGNLNVMSGTYNISPENHDGDWNLWYRFDLTMKTDTGQEIKVSKEILPQHTTLFVNSQPYAFDIKVNGGVQPSPYSFTAISGVQQKLEPSNEVFFGGDFGRFEHWLVTPGWGTPRSPSVEITTTRILEFDAPVERTMYSVQYVYDRPGLKTYLPSIISGEE